MMKEIDATHVVADVSVRVGIEQIGLSKETTDGIMLAIGDRITDKMAEDMVYTYATGAFWMPVGDDHPFRDITYQDRRSPI